MIVVITNNNELMNQWYLIFLPKMKRIEQTQIQNAKYHESQRTLTINTPGYHYGTLMVISIT